MKSKSKPEEVAKSKTEEVLAKIAAKVREDSKNLKRLTRVDLFAALTPERTGVRAYLAEMASSASYQDIKPITIATGSIYLYSETFMVRKDAERLARDEEVRSQIVARVREDSEKSVKLTAVNSLGALIPEAEPDRIDRHLAVLQGDERYQDVKLITNSRGGRYLYSGTFMTRTYAEVLARAEANDPLLTIAETVRDQSRIFRRPTNSRLFDAPVFRIDTESLDVYVAELLRRPEFADIKLIHASTGAPYLYSDIYIKSEEWVKSIVEREEVWKPENP